MEFSVLITGASSGIGLELAKIFASQKYSLVLVARNIEALDKLAQQLRSAHGVTCVTITADLSKPDAATALAMEIEKKGIVIDVLVNNAGAGLSGEFSKSNPTKNTEMMNLNMYSLVGLTRYFLPQMIKRGRGKILMVSSTAAFLPGPMMALYYASKAFVLSLSEALSEEIKGSGVSLSILCPGPTITEFQRRANLETSRLFNSGISMTAEQVARKAFRGLMAGKRVIIPGFFNKIMMWSIPFTPKGILLWMVKRLHQSVM